jgi:uncharacterized membrane protein
MRGYYMGYAPHAFGFGGWGMLVFGLLVLAALVVVIVMLARRKGLNKSFTSEEKKKAFGILAERFAKGDIDAETFKSMKEEIEKTL